MRKKPYTTTEYFTLVTDILKENGEYPSIDYALAAHSPREIRDYSFDITSCLKYGGSEGIYLDLYIVFGSGEKYALGTFKTLGEKKEDMEIMGKLLADFVYESNRFVNRNLDDFTWSGYKCAAFDKEGNPAPFSWDCAPEEKAFAKKNEFLEKGWAKVVITNYATRAEKVYTRQERDSTTTYI